jgi:hypothetical protein
MEGSTGKTATLLIAVAPFLLLAGCIHSDSHRSGFIDGHPWSERVADTVDQAYIDELRSELLALGDEVGEDEATLLADRAVRHADELRRQYRMVRPIELHNVLVNLGLRKRGLCYQCAEDMYVCVRDLKLKTLDLYWGVAHKGDLWLEHSGVIVTARGHPFSEGLVLDAWRHSGRLRWARVDGDRYPWVKMFKRKFMETGPQPHEFDDAVVAAHRSSGNRADSRAAAVRASPSREGAGGG